MEENNLNIKVEEKAPLINIGIGVKSKKAFTLAEVLITLGVIGVIAAMTLPTVIKNYQKKVTVERLKSTYSMLYQAVRMSEVDNGTLDTWEMPDGTTYDISKTFAKKYFTPYLKNTRECMAKDCFSDCYNLDGTGEKDNTQYYTLQLANGVLITFHPRNSLAEMKIDINGKKGPNIRGKDKFSLILTKQAISSNYFGIQSKPGLYFYGQGLSNDYLKTKHYACSKTKGTGNRGIFCGALIMQNNWQMPEDYPW